MTSTGYQLTLVDADGNDLLELMENDAGEYRFDAEGQDATFGNPVPVSDVISSLMSDGGLTTIKSFNNRTAVFMESIKGADMGIVSDGEAELMSALDRTVALRWDVPWAASSYFDVVACWSEHAMDDLGEVQQKQRRFQLTFECLPFARSKDPVTVTWSPPVELSTLTTMTGWTTVSGSASYSGGLRTTSTWRAQKMFTVDEYLWFKVARTSPAATSAAITSVSINGTAIPDVKVRHEGFGISETTQFFTVPVGAWRGQSVTVEFTLSAASATNATLTELWTWSYPTSASGAGDTQPKGIGLLDVIGTARTPCKITFTNGASGSFVYTGPNPNVAIRRGAPEAVYAVFTISNPDGAEVSVGSQLMWFPPGTHTTNVGVTAPQPVELHPDGVWPTQTSGAVTLGGVSGSQWSYPVDEKAAISYFSSTGTKTLISASPSLPQGYHGDAVTHEEHVLHPGECGFGVVDVAGNPVTATITYYPRWKHYAAQ